MHPVASEKDLLDTAARRIGVETEVLLRRYYGSPEDARQELDEIDRTGRLQPSLARLLRLELAVPQVPAE